MSSSYTTNPKTRTGFTMHEILQNKKTSENGTFRTLPLKTATVANLPMFAPGTSANISEHFEHFTPFLEHSVQIITIAVLIHLKPINMTQLGTCANNGNAIMQLAQVLYTCEYPKQAENVPYIERDCRAYIPMTESYFCAIVSNAFELMCL